MLWFMCFRVHATKRRKRARKEANQPWASFFIKRKSSLHTSNDSFKVYNIKLIKFGHKLILNWHNCYRSICSPLVAFLSVSLSLFFWYLYSLSLCYFACVRGHVKRITRLTHLSLPCIKQQPYQWQRLNSAFYGIFTWRKNSANLRPIWCCCTWTFCALELCKYQLCFFLMYAVSIGKAFEWYIPSNWNHLSLLLRTAYQII